jgi:hypothetical protein
MSRTLLRSPWPWVSLVGTGLLIATCVPPDWPAGLFWSGVLASCTGAAGWVLTTDLDDAP